ncbi:MAG: 16S rRNA (cytosine(1402)-N(4))-methyltransferase RsmH [Bacteroidetes bacterium]|nr:16S rRNA (cytosine(1402)-N(4))-methyltransferase RsmH [Bacteroidota bacterium]
MTNSEYHIPVLLKQCIDGLNIKQGGVYVDATYGGGGHSKEILKNSKVKKIFAIDQDSDAVLNKVDDDRLIFINHNFRYMKRFLKYYKSLPVDGVLADLGISSFQVDEKTKGFSYRFDEKIDMRMDRDSTIDATKILNDYEFDKLNFIFKNYGELNNSASIANSIIQYRTSKKIEKVSDLLNAIKSLTPKKGDYAFFSKVFQAIRIEVNNEIINLELFLKQCEKSIKPKGRLVIISYHSLEDRCVKNYINTGNFEGISVKDNFGNLIRPFEPINKKVIIPDESEIATNPRARSAKLRIAEKN